MDWNAAIEKNREALKRVLAMLVVMAAPPGGGATLPRDLHRAVLRLLRPAEAAARRLIIVMARGLVVALPPPRKPRPKPKTTEPLLRSLGIAVVMSPADLERAAAETMRAAAIRVPRPRILSLSKGSLPLLDPLRSPLSWSKGRRRNVPAHAAPRILFPGVTEPSFLPPPQGPASPDDPIDAARLALRLAALAAALDDLPGQAKRFARWKARRDAMIAQRKEAGGEGAQKKEVGKSAGRFFRLWPLRPGRPPGWRRKPVNEVHEVLNVVHGLAFWALETPDTS